MSRDEFMYEFGQNLKEAMDTAEMNARDLAIEIAVGESTISRYINGTRLPDLLTLVNIAYALACDLDDLIDVSEMIE